MVAKTASKGYVKGVCERRGGEELRGCVCLYIYKNMVLTRFRPEPKSPDQRPRAPTEGHNQWNRLCTDLSRYTRNFSPPSDTSESTRPVTVPRNTTHTVCWHTITSEFTIPLSTLLYYLHFFPWYRSIISFYCDIVLECCVIRITVMVFTRHRPRSRGPTITGIYIYIIDNNTQCTICNVKTDSKNIYITHPHWRKKGGLGSITIPNFKINTTK